MACTPSQVCRCPVCSRQLLAPPAWRAGAVSLAVRESAPQLSVPDLAGRIVEVPAQRSQQIPQPPPLLEPPRPPPGPKEATSSAAEHPEQGSAPRAPTPPLLVVVFPSAQEAAAPQTPLPLPQTVPLAGGLELEASSCQVDVALQPPEALADTSRESLRALGSLPSSVDPELFPEEALAPPEEVSGSARLKASWGEGEVPREAALRAASIVTLEAPPQNVTERHEELPSPRSAPSESSEGPPLPEAHSAQEAPEAQPATLTAPPTGVSHRDAEAQTRSPDVIGQSSEPDAGLPPGAFSLIRITSMRKRQAQRRAAERAKAPEPKERVYRAAASIDAAMRLTKRPQRPAMTVLRDPR